MRSALLSGNPVTTLIWLPARVSTSIPLARARVADVEAERGLAVGPDRHETGGAPRPERGRGPEPGGQLAALVPQRYRRHDQPDVLGKQGDDLMHVTCFVGLGEPLHERTFPRGTGRRRFGVGCPCPPVLQGGPGALEGTGHRLLG
jgi:hypothetical protein